MSVDAGIVGRNSLVANRAHLVVSQGLATPLGEIASRRDHPQDAYTSVKGLAAIARRVIVSIVETAVRR
jgi:hypothetical protein